MRFSEPWWEPTPSEIERAELTRFMRYCNGRFNLDMRDFWDLWRWSTSEADQMNDFYTALWDWRRIQGDKGPAPLFDATRRIQDTHLHVPHARVNFAENVLLGHSSARSKSKLAIIARIEPPAGSDYSKIPPAVRQLTYDELYLEVAQVASRFRSLGLGPGSRVAALTPNNAEAIVVLLAASSIGAIFSSVSPEFGAKSILERLTQFQPRVLLTSDYYRANGQDFGVLGKLLQIVPALRSTGLTTVIIVGQLESNRQPSCLAELDGVTVSSYFDFLDRSAGPIRFERLPGCSPLWVLFSSGTTGRPKAIVHSAIGMLFAEGIAAMHHGKSADDVLLQVTTTGWMMWNTVVMSLLNGSTVIAYDGNPFFPSKTTLFDLIDEHNVTYFSTSPRYLQLLLSGGFKPRQSHRLERLKLLACAGSPLKPELYDYIRDEIKAVFIANSSGGTDVCGGIVAAVPTLPIYAGVIQGPMLGCAVAVYDDAANKIDLGEGDLVIERPMPNMPLGFLHDADRTKFLAAYFDHYQLERKVWYHGDHIAIDEHAGYTMLGRSDGVLNPQGVRFGSAELYAVVEEFKEKVEDCIAVGQRMPDGDERVVLFVKPRGANKLSAELYTANGKRVEVAVKKLVNGTSLSRINTGGLGNPAALDFFVNHPELDVNARAHL
ncbi:hypothetical protein OIV83_005622 [Microbotryomycetes sp. JL201]|nr:hypothetical protein OIV83_005622 [Microbotryomycetes sp. JL201]